MSVIARTKVSVIALTLAGIFMLFAIGFAGVALYQLFAMLFLPDVAALLTAAIFLLIAILVLIAAKIYSAVDKRSTPRPSGRTQNLEEVLNRSVDPEIARWVKQHPGSSLGVSLFAGILAGYNRDSRQAIAAFCKDFFGGGEPPSKSE